MCGASILYNFHFFFQAEDGIRDIGVTGVQTCALPIYGGTDNIFYFFYKIIIFSLHKEKDDI